MSQKPDPFYKVPKELAECREIGAMDKLLLMYLNSLGSHWGKIFPKIETMATKLGCCEKTIRSTISRLEKKGILIRIKRWKSYEYVINMPGEINSVQSRKDARS